MFEASTKAEKEARLLREEIMAKIDYWHMKMPAIGSRKIMILLQREGYGVTKSVVRKNKQVSCYKKNMTIATIIGVRPQFVKAAVLSPVIRKEHKEILIHTGQHYDDNMSAVFFRELGLPQPDYVLDGKSGACAEVDRVERMTDALVSVLQKEPVDAVLLYGDTASTLAGALAADRVKIPAIHVEAGERNGLVNSPEEKIRKTVDQLSSLLLCCTEQAVANLQEEGLGDRAYYIGNLMELSFLKNVRKPWRPGLVRLTEPVGQVVSVPRKFYLLTCHRQENANEKNVTEILLAMEQAKYPVIFPVHPRNRERVLKVYGEILCSKRTMQTGDEWFAL